MADDQDLTPTPKVAAGGVAGAASIVIVFALGEVGVEIPPTVGAAITALLAFAASYIKKGEA